MNIHLSVVIAAAIAAAPLGGAAQAAKLCHLTGTYTDRDGFFTAEIQGKKGQLVGSEICPTPYHVRILFETQTGFTIDGGNKTQSCGRLETKAVFDKGCSVFSVTGSLNGQRFNDVFTKQKDARVPPTAPAGLSLGFK